MWQGDYHTHSTLDDGKSTLEEMAAAAHALGLPRFGFSGHSWCPWEEDYCIQKNRIAEYLTTVRTLRDRYAGKMEIFLSWISTGSGPRDWIMQSGQFTA